MPCITPQKVDCVRTHRRSRIRLRSTDWAIRPYTLTNTKHIQYHTHSPTPNKLFLLHFLTMQGQLLEIEFSNNRTVNHSTNILPNCSQRGTNQACFILSAKKSKRQRLIFLTVRVKDVLSDMKFSVDFFFFFGVVCFI